MAEGAHLPSFVDNFSGKGRSTRERLDRRSPAVVWPRRPTVETRAAINNRIQRLQYSRQDDRVDDGSGSSGTVRYVGPVATAKNASTLYYGIEWDEWGRGKNDGSVELPSGERVVHYSGPPGRKVSGHGSPECYKCSFVKASVFDKTAERKQYSKSEEGTPGDVVVAGEVGTTLGSEKPIEFVGAKKLSTQQTLQTIEKISLSCCQIVKLGGQGLGELAPNLTELDLSRNLFSEWSDIIAVIRELPLLETLILSGNKLTIEEENDSSKLAIFENLKVLVLSYTLLSWKNVGAIITRHLPKLEQLHVVGNEYEDNQLTEWEPTGGWLETLSVLDLSLNRLKSWSKVLQVVGEFANLSQLFLHGNQIVTLVADVKPTSFQQLTTLSLSENLVDSWTSIDALNAFPLLDTLRFSKNPLTTQMSLGEGRLLFVARPDHIAVFNASPVREKERKEAEQLYLNSIGDLIATLFVVEVCDKGSEATVMGLMITISALGTPFSTVLYKTVDSYFHIERKYIVKDDHHVRSQVTYAYLIAYACNLLSVLFVVWLPRQKADVHALKARGGKSKLLGMLTVCYLVFAFCWIVMTNALSLSDSTSCLRIAGGSGC
ncbi:hypothetical protein PInf_008642 [Phytophthora infestans]|nr:hypothetical protein PInf_008642 [Phytophthora infestans]